MAVTEFPIRLLQSAGDITTCTSRVTAFLESQLNPICESFCQNSIIEHWRDCKNYLLELESWKSSLETNYTENSIINTADVQALHPSINKNLVKKSLWRALKHHSKFNYKALTILVDLTVFCLNNVILQYKEKFYRQTNRIITRDNHSVSLANIAMHFVLLPISETLNKASIFKVLLMILFG